MAKKNIVLGVTGGIAVYKSCYLVSALVKAGYGVHVVMTQNATEFVTPLTFETMSQNKVVKDTFDKNREFEVEHISLAKLADVFVIAPATANVIGKLAEGIADDMLTTTAMAMTCPKIICPAMNTAMYENPAVQENMEKLRSRGYSFIEPGSGRLACGDVGKGKMAEPEQIFAVIDKLLTPNPDFRGRTILVTAGATSEPIDGVRFITNRSSGKMGIAIADDAINRGARVILVCGPVTAPIPKGAEVIRVSTTKEMYDAVLAKVPEADVIIKAAAPSDYRPEVFSPSKIKSETLTLKLVKNPDIAKAVGEIKGDKKLVIFSAETENLIENAAKKLESKNADMVVANDVTMQGAGFDVDTNIATLLKKDGTMIGLPIMTKSALASEILTEILSL